MLRGGWVMARRMKTALGAMALALAVSGGAQAADMPLRGSLPGYEVAPAMDWGGFYVGGFGGLGTMNMNLNGGSQNYVNDVLRGYAFGDGSSQGSTISNLMHLDQVKRSPTVFGAFVGYQMQFEDAVIGIEADYTRLGGGRGGATSFTPPASLLISGTGFVDRITPTASASAELMDYWTLRGRAGWAYGRVMPYVTAGVALARGSAAFGYQASCTRTITDATANPSPFCVGGVAPTSRGGGATTAFGYTAGIGVEALITNNLFVRAEYQIVNIPSMAGVPILLQTARAGIGLKY